ncbi:MAG: YIP1 family protein [Oscillospiraceae bacterium]|nr:YIP1 family protein [Oscillospiraceae bacterium]
MIKTKLKDMFSTLLYGFHACIHPFEGFYNIKHFRKQNLPAAVVILLATMVVIILKMQATGFLFQVGNPERNNVLLQVVAVLVPVGVWSVVNWSVTTLFEGKATMRNIFITTCFSLLPMVILYIPQVILSHFFTEEEGSFMMIIDALVIIWVVWLLLAGLASVQDYTMVKTIVTSVVTILAIIALIFLLAVFYSAIQQLVSFFSTVFNELTYWIR